MAWTKANTWVKDMLEFSGKIVYRVYVSDPYQVLEEIFLGGSPAESDPL